MKTNQYLRKRWKQKFFIGALFSITFMGVALARADKTAKIQEAGIMDYESSQQEDLTFSNAKDLKIGDLAPDFNLNKLTGTELSSEKTLHSLLNKPTVLLFGSYTCGLTKKRIPGMNELFNVYNDKVNFAFVYMKEAHPMPEKSVEIGSETVFLQQPESIERRCQLGGYLIEKRELTLPVYIDDMQGSARKAYGSYHLAAYIIDENMRITFVRKYKYEVTDLQEALEATLQNAGPMIEP